MQNHSVVQSTFDQPCIPIQNMMANKTDAFFSGFMPTNASFTATSNILTYTIRVKDEKPMWFYCSQGKHCQAGMVGAVNAYVLSTLYDMCCILTVYKSRIRQQDHVRLRGPRRSSN
jgi:hypothetical protein